MTLEVEPEELRSAAKKLDKAAQPLACLHVPTKGATGEAFGHVELASWTVAMLEYSAEINGQLSSEASTMAGSLRATADDLEARDRQAGQLFQSPLQDWLDLNPPQAPATTGPGGAQGGDR